MPGTRWVLTRMPLSPHKPPTSPPASGTGRQENEQRSSGVNISRKSALTDPRTFQVQVTEFLCPDSSPEEGSGHPPVPVRDRGDGTCQATGMVSDTQQSSQFKSGSHAVVRPVIPHHLSQKQSKCETKENGEHRTLPYQDIQGIVFKKLSWPLPAWALFVTALSYKVSGTF